MTLEESEYMTYCFATILNYMGSDTIHVRWLSLYSNWGSLDVFV